MWDCDVEGSYLVEMPPDEDASGHLDDVLGGGVQPEGEGLDREATTPICGSSWSTDGEATPLFSSNFPRLPDHSDCGMKESALKNPSL